MGQLFPMCGDLTPVTEDLLSGLEIWLRPWFSFNVVAAEQGRGARRAAPDRAVDSGNKGVQVAIALSSVRSAYQIVSNRSRGRLPTTPPAPASPDLEA